MTNKIEKKIENLEASNKRLETKLDELKLRVEPERVVWPTSEYRWFGVFWLFFVAVAISVFCYIYGP